MCSLAYNFFPLIFFDKFYICVDFCYKLISINKFIRHGRVNNPYYNVKYLNLYLFISFSFRYG